MLRIQPGGQYAGDVWEMVALTTDPVVGQVCSSSSRAALALRHSFRSPRASSRAGGGGGGGCGFCFCVGGALCGMPVPLGCGPASLSWLRKDSGGPVSVKPIPPKHAPRTSLCAQVRAHTSPRTQFCVPAQSHAPTHTPTTPSKSPPKTPTLPFTLPQMSVVEIRKCSPL